ncbi:MAG: NAD(P)-binding domain-containing protein, partial [Chlamydiales bacterium]|nr:NAD(P)-binding domain-containing protein [Chlamydiales bacterium]
LEKKVRKDLELMNLPAASWRLEDDDICDVAVIGAGQAGIAIAHALQLEGIHNVRVFDSAKDGEEGPWLTTARMRTLRSGKQLRGPANLPHLTFQAWCEAKYGPEKWEAVGRIPTNAWGKYLQWLKKTTGVAVYNGWKLQNIVPNEDQTLQLHFANEQVIHCRKVVLATGQTGFGGAELPSFTTRIPKRYWAHTSDRIDASLLRNKHVTVIGVGASGYDAAALALEGGADRVQMLMRKQELPAVNHAASFAYVGFMRGFYYLKNKERYQYCTKVLDAGIPPPQDSIDRIKSFSNFELLASTKIKAVSFADNKRIKVETNHGIIFTDFLILATGFAIDGSKQPELQGFIDQIQLWKDRVPDIDAKYGRYPYLGPHFEFLERKLGSASFLGNIHCFNMGGFLSHGRICGDLDGLHVGVQRLVEGISIDLFLQDTCRNGEPTPHECPGTCQIGLCSPFSLEDLEDS